MENDLIEHRVCKLEKDVDTLYAKANTAAVAQAENNIKLDNVLVAIGELKGIVQSLTARPGKWWDKLVAGLIGACASGFISYAVLNTIK